MVGLLKNHLTQNNHMTKRIKSFLWRAGAFVAVAIAGYLMNIGDVREVDPWTLATIFTVTISTYIFNEFTKYLNVDKPVAKEKKK